MAGFSGGGQFAQRFFYLYPERLHAVSIGAPGRVTRLDRTLDWPQGIKNVQEKFSMSVDFEKLKAVTAIQLIVGGEDTVVHGGEEFSKWLEEARKSRNKKDSDSDTSSDQLAPMRVGRVQLTKETFEEWKAIGIEARFDVVPGVAHNPQGVVNVVLSFLQPLVAHVYGQQ